LSRRRSSRFRFANRAIRSLPKANQDETIDEYYEGHGQNVVDERVRVMIHHRVKFKHAQELKPIVEHAYEYHGAWAIHDRGKVGIE
jgi:hypothetical protein